MIVLELTQAQAEELRRDLMRAIVLLDRASLLVDDPLHRHACLQQSHRLAAFAHDLEELALGRAVRSQVAG